MYIGMSVVVFGTHSFKGCFVDDQVQNKVPHQVDGEASALTRDQIALLQTVIVIEVLHTVLGLKDAEAIPISFPTFVSSFLYVAGILCPILCL